MTNMDSFLCIELPEKTFQGGLGLVLQSIHVEPPEKTFQGGLGRALDWTRIGLSNDRNQQLRIDLNPVGRPQICGSDARKSDNC